ncbi:hypothetical protein tb265_00690 [Gemmatimonadetes bacterium T265]|nr:hypothetical protein tb265_00690 [Gemmatimonadetes bacterium T265]
MRHAHGSAALTIAVACLLPARASAQTGPRSAEEPKGARPRPGAASPAPACKVEGVWELVSVSYNGQELPRPGYHERKVVARGQFMWLGSDAQRDTIPLRTAGDSLRAFRVAGGAGTYTLTGNTYTEHLEYFYDPRLVGQSIQATCRTEGDRWYHSFTPATPSGGAGGQSERLDQVWRRVS